MALKYIHSCYAQDVEEMQNEKKTVEDLDDKSFMMHRQRHGPEEHAIILEYSEGRNRRNAIPPLSELRVNLVDTMVKYLLDYFPEGSFDMFDILNPKNLPRNLGEIYAFSSGIMPLANRFNADEMKACQQLTSFLSNVITNDREKFIQMKNSNNPAIFWNYCLNSNFQPEEDLKSLIKIALVIPVGSAEAERGFSILKHIRYDRRNRLTTGHIEDLLRIRINGLPLEDFDAARYTNVWLQSHMDTADPSKTRGRGRTAEDERDEDSNEHEAINRSGHTLQRSNLF